MGGDDKPGPTSCVPSEQADLALLRLPKSLQGRGAHDLPRQPRVLPANLDQQDFQALLHTSRATWEDCSRFLGASKAS